MKTKYRLKPWDDVKNHHFISKETWDFLAKSDLEVEMGRGIFMTSAIICPKDECNLANTYVVSKTDLDKVEEKKPCGTCTNNHNCKDEPVKTYTKDDIRSAGADVMKDINDLDDAIASAVAIAKLIDKLN